MASEIRVDKINSLSGVGTVTLSPTGVDISGITTVSTLKVGTGLTASSDGDVFFTGIATATTFVGNLTGDPTGSGANLTALPAGQLTGTVADARISTLTASKLSGALPAISAANLTNVPAANVVGVHTSLTVTNTTTTGTAVVGGGVTISESGIEASGIGITCANINGTKIGSRRNLVINGAMTVAQRGTSSTSAGYQTVDRFYIESYGVDETPTQEQVDVSSGDTGPYQEGFRKCLKITNGNQTSGAGNQDLIVIFYTFEARDIANSGWNYTSASSFITLSFWINSSVAQNFYGRFYTYDGTAQGFAFETGSLTAGEWKKVTVTIPGNSNITIDDNVNSGLLLEISAFRGTGGTASMTLNQWAAYNSNARTPDQTSTWYTTNNATLEVTGVQLEVGSQATPFEHHSHGEELALCRRYFYRIGDGTNTYQVVGNGYVGENGGTRCAKIVIHPLTTMRTTPTISVIGTDAFRATAGGSTMNVTATSNTGGIWNSASTGDIMWMDFGQSGGTTLTNGYGCVVYADNNSANLALSAEL